MIGDHSKRDGGRNRGPIPLPNFSPGPHDVVCGRGKQVYQHEGNVRFRSLVADRMNEYDEADSKAGKTAIVTQIIERVRNSDPPGGFVRFEEGMWYEVGDFVAREKVGTQFRDLLHTKYKSSTISKKNRKRSKELQQQQQQKQQQQQERQSATDEQVEALHQSIGSESFESERLQGSDSFDSQRLHHSVGSDSFESSQRIQNSTGSDSFDSQQQTQQTDHYRQHQYDRDGRASSHHRSGEHYGPTTYHHPAYAPMDRGGSQYISHVTPQHYHYHHYPHHIQHPGDPRARGAITPHPSMPPAHHQQQTFDSPQQEVIEPVSYEEVFADRRGMQMQVDTAPQFIDGIQSLLTSTPDQHRSNSDDNETPARDSHDRKAPSWPDDL